MSGPVEWHHGMNVGESRCHVCGHLIEDAAYHWYRFSPDQDRCLTCGPPAMSATRPDLPIQPPVTTSPPRGEGCTGHEAARRAEQRRERPLREIAEQVAEQVEHRPRPGALRPPPEQREKAGQEWRALNVERHFWAVLCAVIRRDANKYAAQGYVNEAREIVKVALRSLGEEPL